MQSRLRLSILAVALMLGLVVPAAAQNARAAGTVRDTNGKPIKGATIRATNPDAIPPEVTAVSNNDGRWAMIGLRSGTYTFTAEAPDFFPMKTDAPTRTANNPAINFVLPRDPGPVPGALTANIQGQLDAANALRDQGRFEQAIAAYQDIRSKNPKLTTVNLVLGDVYRTRASKEPDTAAKRAFLEQAIASYDEVLKADATHERARTGRAEAAAAR